MSAYRKMAVLLYATCFCMLMANKSVHMQEMSVTNAVDMITEELEEDNVEEKVDDEDVTVSFLTVPIKRIEYENNVTLCNLRNDSAGTLSGDLDDEMFMDIESLKQHLLNENNKFDDNLTEIVLAVTHNDVNSVLVSEVLAVILHDFLGYNVTIQSYQVEVLTKDGQGGGGDGEDSVTDTCPGSIRGQMTTGNILVQSITNLCDSPIGTCRAALSKIQDMLLPNGTSINLMGKFASYGFARENVDDILLCIETDMDAMSQCSIPNVGYKFGKGNGITFNGILGTSTSSGIYLPTQFSQEMWEEKQIAAAYWMSLRDTELTRLLGNPSTNPENITSETTKFCPNSFIPDDCTPEGFYPGPYCSGDKAENCGQIFSSYPCADATLVPQIVRNLGLNVSVGWLGAQLDQTVVEHFMNDKPIYFFHYEPSILVNTLRSQQAIRRMILPEFNIQGYEGTLNEGKWNVENGKVNSSFPILLEGKFVSSDLHKVAPSAFKTSSMFNMSNEALGRLLTDYTIDAAEKGYKNIAEVVHMSSARHVACQFVAERIDEVESIVACNPGSTYNFTQHRCVFCAPGTYAAIDSLNCVPASKGFHAPNFGSSFQIPCAIGTYNNETGREFCAQCPKNTISQAPGSINCIPCSTGQRASAQRDKCIELSETSEVAFVIPIVITLALLFISCAFTVLMWLRMKRQKNIEGLELMRKQMQVISLEAPINKAIDVMEKYIKWHDKCSYFWPIMRLFGFGNLPTYEDVVSLARDLKSGRDPRIPYIQYELGENVIRDADLVLKKSNEESAPSGVVSDKMFLASAQSLAVYGGWDFDIFDWILDGQHLNTSSLDMSTESLDFKEPNDSLTIWQPYYQGCLVKLAMHIFESGDLFDHFMIDKAAFERFVEEVQTLHHDNPFHNVMHSADVLQCMHFILQASSLRNVLSDEYVLAAYIAAIVLDVGHLGVTNNFLSASQHQLAMTYCLDPAIQECMHASLFCQLIHAKQTNFLTRASSHINPSTIKEIVLALITATDMNKHFQILNTFQTVQHITRDMLLIGLTEEDDVDISKPREPVQDRALLYLQVAIKCADLGWTGKPLKVHKKWIKWYHEELYAQGDKERQLGFRVPITNDRKKCTLQTHAQAQLAFYEFIVHPMFKSLESVFPETKAMAANAEKNFWYWHMMKS